VAVARAAEQVSLLGPVEGGDRRNRPAQFGGGAVGTANLAQIGELLERVDEISDGLTPWRRRWPVPQAAARAWRRSAASP
jgi:hypothetical protein